MQKLHVPWESLSTHRTDVGFVDASVVWAHVVRHAIFPLKALLAYRTLEWFFVRVWQLVPVQMVNVPEGFPAHFTAVVLLYGLGWLFGGTVLGHVGHGHRGHDSRGRGRGSGCSGKDASDGWDVGRVARGLTGHGGDKRDHGGCRLRRLFGSGHHFDASVAGLVSAEVVAVAEGLVAVAADERRLALVLFLDHGHWTTSSGIATPSSPRPAGYVVLEKLSNADGGLVVQRNGHHRLLVLRLRVQQWQQAVRGHMVLVVKGFISLLEGEDRTRQEG